MQSNFEPVHLKKANKLLSKHLKRVEIDTHTVLNKINKKVSIEKPSFLEKILTTLKNHF